MRKPDKSSNFIVLSVVASLSTLLFILIWFNLESLSSQKFEHELSDFVQGFRNVELTSYMKLITQIGDLYGYIAIISTLGIILLLKRRFNSVIQIVSVVISAALLNVVLKSLIDRPRPYGEALVKVNFNSFPSGHAMSAVVFYGLMIYFLFEFKSLGLKFLLSIICVFMILLIGVSRIYLGVHYPTDLVAGYLAGLTVLSIYLMIIQRFRRKSI